MMRPVAVLCITVMLTGLLAPGTALAACSDEDVMRMANEEGKSQAQIEEICGKGGHVMTPEEVKKQEEYLQQKKKEDAARALQEKLENDAKAAARLVELKHQQEETFRNSVAATAVNEQVTVSWNAVDGATGYTVYYSKSPEVTPETGKAVRAGTDTSVVVTDLSEGTTYYFVVTATYAGGPGPSSIQVSATTPTLPASHKWLAWVGGILVVAGAAIAVPAQSSAASYATKGKDANSANDQAGWDSARTKYNAAVSDMNTGVALAGAGVALIALYLILRPRSSSTAMDDDPAHHLIVEANVQGISTGYAWHW